MSVENIQLSTNFNLREFFNPNDRGVTWRSRTWPQHNITVRPRPDDNLIHNLQTLRDMFGRPVTITSGIRSVEHNSTLRGASANSAHMTGAAADFQVRQTTRNKQVLRALTVREMVEVVQRAFNQGLLKGLGFVYAGSTFVHIGVDSEVPRRSIWGAGFV